MLSDVPGAQIGPGGRRPSPIPGCRDLWRPHNGRHLAAVTEGALGSHRFRRERRRGRGLHNRMRSCQPQPSSASFRSLLIRRIPVLEAQEQRGIGNREREREKNNRDDHLMHTCGVSYARRFLTRPVVMTTLDDLIPRFTSKTRGCSSIRMRDCMAERADALLPWMRVWTRQSSRWLRES